MTSFLNTPRGRFFYREHPGQQPCLLFLHGNLGTSRWWSPILQRLPDGWRGIAYDAIGYGRSDRSQDLTKFSVPGRLRDLIAFIEGLGLSHIHLIAHSTATPVAIEYALLAPDNLATLTLIGPVPTSGVKTPPEAYPYLEHLPADRDLQAKALRASAPHFDHATPEAQALLNDIAALDPLTLPAIARGLDAWQPGDRLRQLTTPVMIVRGYDDLMLDEKQAHQTLLSIPGAGNLEMLHGAGHSPMLETPEGLTELLVTFISDDWETFETIRQRFDEEEEKYDDELKKPPHR